MYRSYILRQNAKINGVSLCKIFWNMKAGHIKSLNHRLNITWSWLRCHLDKYGFENYILVPLIFSLLIWGLKNVHGNSQIILIKGLNFIQFIINRMTSLNCSKCINGSLYIACRVTVLLRTWSHFVWRPV